MSSVQSTHTTSGSSQRFLYKVASGFALAALILLLIGFASYSSLKEFEETTARVAHAQEVLATLQAVLSNALEAVSGVRGYVVTGKARFLEPYEKALDALAYDQTRLSILLSDSPEQMQRLEQLKRLIDQQLVLLKAKIALRNDPTYNPAMLEPFMDRNKAIMDSTRIAVHDMQKREKALLVMREQHADTNGGIALLSFQVGIGLEIIILIWVALQIRREIAARQQAQEDLRQAHDELEVRIQQRTKALSEAKERLQILSHRLIEVQEEERRHIARDLHDEIGQSLTAMKLCLREAHQSPEEPAATFLADSLDILNQVLQQVRTLALDLRPSLLDELGLKPALKWYLARQGERAGWKTEFDVDDQIDRLSSDIEIACFRTAQEALTNVARHAEATHVSVTLRREDNHLLLSIRDNGKGFDLAQAQARAHGGGSIGLLGMEERVRLVGGQMSIVSSSEAGTTVFARFPCAALALQPVHSLGLS